MVEPHVIRLRGPWELQPLASWQSSDNSLPKGGRLEMPSDWSKLLGADFRGRVRHLRRFGRPTGLDAGERVWLVCDGATDAATIFLNGAQLGAVISGSNQPARFEVTDRLLRRNELVIDVEFPAAEATNPSDAAAFRCGGLTGGVRLEIVD